jgi:uncharacterized protein YndB with AHSA1/START domain
MTSQLIHPAPVRKSVTVPAAPDRAFHVFTAEMAQWWFKGHSIAPSGMAGLIVEPFSGGRWYEVGQNGEECDWGRVRHWEPPARLVLAWQLSAEFAFDPGLDTEVEVTFRAVAPGQTRVDLEHRGLQNYGAQAAAMAETFGSDGGWGGLLAGFAALIRG